MDPLSVLRDFTIRGELDKVVQINNEFRFGTQFIFPCDIETAFRSSSIDECLYVLRTLVFFIKNQHLSPVTYMQNSIAHRIPVVRFRDRKPLLDYLTGEISSSDSIVSINHHKPTLTKLRMEDNSFKANVKEGSVESLNITLRPLELSDIDDLMVWATDDELNRFCEWDFPYTKEDGIKFIKNFVTPHPWYRAICLNNRVIGTISVAHNSDEEICRAELSYVLASKYWGKGIATQAVKIVTNTIFSEWSGLERLEALADVEHVGSQRVLEKAGFKREGILRKYMIWNGRTRDIVMFSLLSTDPKI